MGELTQPTVDDVRAEIEALREVRPHVRRFSKFGDDNWEAIDVQVAVLEGGFDWEVIDTRYGDSEFLYGHAFGARRWLSGGATDLEAGLAARWRLLTPSAGIHT